MSNREHHLRYEIDKTELLTVENICVLCWGLIGDVFIRVAVIEALRQRFPGANIVVVVDPACKVVLQNHPDVNEVFVFSRAKRPLYRYVFNTIKNCILLRRRKFDLSINLYSGGSSPRITRIINATIRLGFDHTKALRKANNLLVKHPSLCTRWTKAFGTILKPLGINDAQIRQGTSYYVSETGKSFAHEFFRGDGNKYIVINLGARIAEKRWSVKRFTQLALQIQEKHSLCPLVLTNPGMTNLTDEFAREYDGKGHYRIAPLLSLDSVAGLMQYCQYVITGDTSIMHLAFGLKCPTLVLFTYTRPDVVEPVDCLHADCFIADDRVKDECGNPMGNADIPITLAYQKFIELLKTDNSLQKRDGLN